MEFFLVQIEKIHFSCSAPLKDTEMNAKVNVTGVKGGLTAWMIFKCFRVIFSLKKKTIQFPLSFNLYFQQK